MTGEAGNVKTVTTRSAEETRALGERLARVLTPGSVVGLEGDLGSGKTCLVQGICGGLGVRGAVTSPTFILVNEYAGKRDDGAAVYLNGVEVEADAPID